MSWMMVGEASRTPWHRVDHAGAADCAWSPLSPRSCCIPVHLGYQYKQNLGEKNISAGWVHYSMWIVSDVSAFCMSMELLSPHPDSAITQFSNQRRQALGRRARFLGQVYALRYRSTARPAVYKISTMRSFSAFSRVVLPRTPDICTLRHGVVLKTLEHGLGPQGPATNVSVSDLRGGCNTAKHSRHHG